MGYEAMGEWHDLFMAPVWERLNPVLVQTFGDLAPGSVVADLGAGTGLGTLALTRASQADVWAVEPQQIMRAVLLHRVVADPVSKQRVSVVAGGIPAALSALPAQVSGVLLAHVIGHLSHAQRSELWRWCAARLAPGGKVVITCGASDKGDEGDKPATEPATVVETVDIGHHLYRATYGEMGTRYEVLDRDGNLLRSADVDYSWSPIGPADLADEVAGFGLAASPSPVTGVLVVAHAAEG